MRTLAATLKCVLFDPLLLLVEISEIYHALYGAGLAPRPRENAFQIPRVSRSVELAMRIDFNLFYEALEECRLLKRRNEERQT